MTPGILILVLFGVGVVLLVAEMLLPAQGILGVLGCGAILWGIGQAFLVNQWLGLGLLAATITCIPVVWTVAMNLWPHTPIGKRIVLAPVNSPVMPPPVGVGQRGVAVSSLRPTGECEFAGWRVEARCDTNTIDSGQPVRVVGIDQGRLIVRAIEQEIEGVT